MKAFRTLFLLLGMAAALGARAQGTGFRHDPESAHPSYKGLVMAGYQGWFHNDGKGVMYPDENRIHIDMWPDVSEYEHTYPTGLKMSDGSTARFFCSDDEQTVATHFRWMREYGLDGVFLQRFYGSCRPRHGSRQHSVTVLRHALKYAGENGRAISVMYDLSGLDPNRSEDCTLLIDDWKFLVDSLKVTSYSRPNQYLYHNGKPLVVIWGVGFPDRPYDIRDIKLAELIDFLHNDPEYGGCSVMLGVPTYWRELFSDCVQDPYLHDLIRMADLVLPWMVQRFTPLLHFEMNRYADMIRKDMEWCAANGVEYVPLVYPGFSWYNLSRGGDDMNDIGGEKPLASIPRQGGKFYWSQIYTAVKTGAEMLYVAMFDEVNEGTAIFKVTDNPPVSTVAKFVGMDGKPSDHYLFLTGEGARMLRGERPLDPKMPERAVENPPYKPWEQIYAEKGFTVEETVIRGRRAVLIVPPGANGRWIARPAFIGAFAQVDDALLARGWSFGLLDLMDEYASPDAQDAFTEFADYARKKHGLSKKVVLEGLSRGGWFSLLYAENHPDRVDKLYLDAPLCDLTRFTRNPYVQSAAQAWEAKGIAPEAFYTYARDHFDRIKKIPIIVVYGAADPIVPFEQQFGTFDLAGCRRLSLIGKTGCAHHPHSLNPCGPIVEFLDKK